MDGGGLEERNFYFSCSCIMTSLFLLLNPPPDQGKGRFVEQSVPVASPGGIFNIEFSTDGKILAAACERKSILLFDPLSRYLLE